jgi:hypothetical protein
MKFTRTPNACEADLGSQSVDTSEFIFKKPRETHQQQNVHFWPSYLTYFAAFERGTMRSIVLGR